MSEIDDGGPAFPAKVSINRDTGSTQPYQFGNNDFMMPGMSLRDHFAGLALEEAISREMGPKGSYQHFCPAACDNIARNAYMVADAMVATRGVQ